MAGTQADLARLIVSLEARLDKFDKAMKKAEGTADKTAKTIETRFDKMQKNLNSLGGRLLGGFSAGVIARGLASIVTEIGNLGEEAKKAGISIQQLQRLTFAALGSGVSSDQIVQAISKLNVELGEAMTKGNDLGKILAANNVELSSLQGDPVKALLKIADLMKSTNDATKIATLGTAAFGKGFRDLIPFLSQGSSAIADKMSEAVTVTDELATRFDVLVDKIAELGKNWEAGIATQLDTSVRELIRIVELAEKFQKALGLAAGQDIAGKIGQILNELDRGDLSRFGIGEPTGLPAGPKQHHPKAREPLPTDQLKIPKALTEEQKKLNAAKERQQDAIDKVVASLKLESDQLSRTSREQEIYNRLADAGIDINDPRAAEIADLAGKFADLQEHIQNVTGEMDFARDATKGFFSDLVSGLREGASLTDTLSKAFSNLADTIINKLINQAVDQLLGPSGTPGGGLLGQLLSGTLGKAGTGAAPVIGGTAPIIPVVSRALGSLSKNNAIGSAGQFGPITQGDLSSGVQFADIIKKAADKYGVEPSLLAGLIKKESGFDQFAVSPRGAMGLTQLMPGTARDLGVTDPFNPTQNIFGGAKYLSDQIKRFGNVPDALAAFNGGPNRLARRGSIGAMPVETQKYVTEVLQNQKEFSGAISSITKAAQTSDAQFSTGFAPALESILTTVLKSVSTLGGGGTVGALTARAFGGPAFPGHGYLVGEQGPEIFVPKVPGLVKPNFTNWNSENRGDGIAVHVTPSKYFDVHVTRIAEAGDQRTFSKATRAVPGRVSSFNKLGT